VKILLLNQTFYPDVAATAQHLSDLAVRLAERGHDVTVLCSRRAYDNPERRYGARELWKGVAIRRISSFGFGKKTRWRRAADFGSYLANCVRHLAALPKFDVVIALTSPPLISYLGALFTRMKGGRFVFWAMDLNPDEAVAAGWLRPDSLTTRVLQKMLYYGLHRAGTIVALDRFMAQRIENKGVPREKIAVLSPWSHDRVVRYDENGRELFRKEHGLEGRFVVMYSGNHSPCHPLITLLEAARRLQGEPQIAFCFVGGGSEFKTVQRFAAEHGLSNVRTLPYQPLARLSASLSSADLHTVVMGDPFVGVIHPCKVYNIRLLRIPYLYIGPEPSHISEMVPQYSAGHGEVDTVARHIRAAAALGMRRVALGSDSAKHGHDRLIGTMVDLLENAGNELRVSSERQWIGSRPEF